MATLQERLTEAETAYHDLSIGKSVRVYVDQNGERLEYTVANAGRLTAYIEALRSQVNGIAPTGPMRIMF